MVLPDRYSLENLLRAVRNPSLFGSEVRRLGYRGAIAVDKRYYSFTREAPTDVYDEDWDVLVILDGCRFDTFVELHGFEGTLESRRSPGSASWEFLSENFGGRECHDTVYVTANPHWYKLDRSTFHAVVDLLDSEWDEELMTVRPESVVRRTLEAAEQYPNKRFVVHFMQPHFPFIGPRGQSIRQKGLTVHLDEDSSDDPNVWVATRKNQVEIEAVREAYRENLRIVLEAVDDLLDGLAGRTVVTSDHGNLLGERLRPIPVRGFGHPPGLYAPELVNVPWHVIPAESRREITADPPREYDDDPDSETVSERLRALGYA